MTLKHTMYAGKMAVNDNRTKSLVINADEEAVKLISNYILFNNADAFLDEHESAKTKDLLNMEFNNVSYSSVVIDMFTGGMDEFLNDTVGPLLWFRFKLSMLFNIKRYLNENKGNPDPVNFSIAEKEGKIIEDIRSDNIKYQFVSSEELDEYILNNTKLNIKFNFGALEKKSKDKVKLI